LNGACAHKAGVCAGKSGAAAREFQGDAPRGWAVEGKQLRAPGRRTMSITRPERQIHNQAEQHTWRLWRRKSNEKLGQSISVHKWIDFFDADMPERIVRPIG
jgi:hypothetical protein